MAFSRAADARASSARAACTCRVPANATAPTGICGWSMRACCSSDSQRKRQPASDLSPSIPVSPRQLTPRVVGLRHCDLLIRDMVCLFATRVFGGLSTQNPLVCRPFLSP